MQLEIQKDIKDRLLILLDSNYCKSIKEEIEEDIKRLINKSILTDNLLIQTLNSIHITAGIILCSTKVNNLNYKGLIEIIKKNNIEPKDGNLEFEKPKSMDEFELLYTQLIRDMKIIEIGNEIIINNKRKNEIIKEINNSLTYINVDELDEKEIYCLKTITTNISNEEKYEEVIECYNELVQDIWKSFLMDSNNMLVHIGTVDEEYQGNILSTSLITEKEVATFTPHGEGIGLIVKPKIIIAADSKDIATDNYKEYQENYFKQRPIIKLPEQIEEELIDQTIEANGENLLYDGIDNPIYSEIVLKDYEIVGYVMLGYGNKSDTQEYKDLEYKSSCKNLIFKYIDINEMRSKQNLQPIRISKNK